MKTIVISAPGEMTVREIETPRPAGGEVLLQMLYVGFCGSDLSTYLGKNPMVQYPRVPGRHKFAPFGRRDRFRSLYMEPPSLHRPL